LKLFIDYDDLMNIYSHWQKRFLSLSL